MRVAVLGVGLIGGSIGLAARERAGATVSGYDAAPEALELRSRARRDRPHLRLDRRLRIRRRGGVRGHAGGSAGPTVGEALAAAGEDCVVTDVGSTKRAIVAAHDDPRFVGGHPLAGAETAGVRHARADLFEGATWYLTPTATTSGVLYERLHRLLRSLGARPDAIDRRDARHDPGHASRTCRTCSPTCSSPRPRERWPKADERLPATGPSFRDATRVAGAPQRDLDRHLPLQPRRAGARDRRRRSPGCRTCAMRYAPATPSA